LKVAANAFATKILIENGRATGVNYVQNGASHAAQARGEIIVCCGVFNTPQLLQLSGLGPAALLQEHGIGVVRNAPAVGAHMQDHFSARIHFRCTQPITFNDIANSFWRRMAAGMQYVLFRTGPLSSNGTAAGGYARTDPRLDRPDIQLNFTTWSFAGRDRKGVHPHPHPGFSVNAVHLRPDARGDVRIKSASPSASPEIRFNFLRTRYDIETLTAGMRLIRKIAHQPALAPYVGEELIPGPGMQSDAEIEEAIRKHGGSNMHPVGSCRMGTSETGVVDPRLRVHGVANLRIIDGSIMPTLPAGNTNAATIMIGEKGADMVLEDARASA
jgi:choline dehydrogenase